MTSSQSYSCELVVFYPHPCTPHSVNSIQQTYYLGFLHIPKDLFSLPNYQNEYNLYMKKRILLFLPAIIELITLLTITISYPTIPKEIPSFWKLSRNTNSWSDKSSIWVAFALMTICSVMMYIQYKYIGHKRDKLKISNSTHIENYNKLSTKQQLILCLNPFLSLSFFLIILLTIRGSSLVGWVFFLQFIVLHSIIIIFLIGLARFVKSKKKDNSRKNAKRR